MGEPAQDLFPADRMLGEVDRFGWPGVSLSKGVSCPRARCGRFSRGANRTVLLRPCGIGVSRLARARQSLRTWSAAWRWDADVELGHQLAVGGAGGLQVLVLLLALQAQVGDVLFEVGDLLVEGVDVGGRA
jgi:hypothetical protein